MSKLTKKFGFIKPELTNVADITAMNENWDKIDDELITIITGTYLGNGTNSKDIDLGVNPKCVIIECADVEFTSCNGAIITPDSPVVYNETDIILNLYSAGFMILSTVGYFNQQGYAYNYIAIC